MNNVEIMNLDKCIERKEAEELVVRFRIWLQDVHPKQRDVGSNDLGQLFAEFLKNEGITDTTSYFGQIKALQNGRVYQELANELAKLGAQIKPDLENEEVDLIERYLTVPLHGVFLYTSEDKNVASYILKNWDALDSLTGEVCDLHPAVNQFNSRENAYDFIAKLDVIKKSQFASYSSLPGLFFWDMQGESEYITFGTNATLDKIKYIVRVVFEEIHQNPGIKGVKNAKVRLGLNEKPNNNKNHSQLLKNLAAFTTVFLVVLGAISLTSRWISQLLLGIILIAVILILILISTFALRQSGKLSESILLNIITQVLNKVPLLRRSKLDEKKNNKN